MKRLVLVAMLVAGCGGTQTTMDGNWLLTSDLANGDLVIHVGGDNPSENVSGSLTLNTSTWPIQGRAGDTDGLVMSAIDNGQRYILFTTVNPSGSLSGNLCLHILGSNVPPDQCGAFLAIRK